MKPATSPFTSSRSSVGGVVEIDHAARLEQCAEAFAELGVPPLTDNAPRVNP